MVREGVALGVSGLEKGRGCKGSCLEVVGEVSGEGLEITGNESSFFELVLSGTVIIRISL